MVTYASSVLGAPRAVIRAVLCLRGLLETCVPLAVLSDILDGQSFMHGYSWFALR